jgi:hypothetical protein
MTLQICLPLHLTVVVTGALLCIIHTPDCQEKSWHDLPSMVLITLHWPSHYHNMPPGKCCVDQPLPIFHSARNVWLE